MAPAGAAPDYGPERPGERVVFTEPTKEDQLKYLEAEPLLRVLESHCPDSDVRLVSISHGGERSYKVEIEITVPAMLGQIGRLEDINQQAQREGMMTVGERDNSVLIYFV